MPRSTSSWRITTSWCRISWSFQIRSWFQGAESNPLLIVEILSPSTRKRDRGVKARRYAELGVEHYWIVDPETKRVECHRLRDGAFRPLVEAEGNTTLKHSDWDGLEIDLAALWR